MAFNFLGALANVSRVFPGYMQGYRSAIQDNWNDMNQYNQVQRGQLSNLYDEATFAPAVDMYNTNADIARFNLINSGLQTVQNMAYLPGQLQSNAVNTAWAPTLAQARNAATYQQTQNLGQGNLAGAMGFSNPRIMALFQQFLSQYMNGQQQTPGATPQG